MTLLYSLVMRRFIAAVLLTLLLLPMVSIADSTGIQSKSEITDTKSSIEETPQPKFVWGILLKFVASQVSDMFMQWAKEKLNKGMKPVMTIPLGEAVSSPESATIGRPTRKDMGEIQPNISDNPPSAPLTVENGKENYQGALFLLLVLQPDGQSFAVRPISAGFKSGEKFRIRMGSTFNGELSIDNVNPRNERSHLYPAQADQVVKIKAGVPVILPLEKDGFFQFDDDTGEEKIVITLRDSRAEGNAASQSVVYRQENEQGTGLLQQVGAGKYAAIAESIPMQHR